MFYHSGVITEHFSVIYDITVRLILLTAEYLVRTLSPWIKYAIINRMHAHLFSRTLITTTPYKSIAAYQNDTCFVIN